MCAICVFSPIVFGAATRPLAAGEGPLGADGGRIVSLWRFIFSWFTLEEDEVATKLSAPKHQIS